jgi:hypothetical protein
VRPARAIVVVLAAVFAAALWSEAADARDRRGHRYQGHAQKHYPPHRHRHHGRTLLFATPLFFVPRHYYPAPVYYGPPPAPTVYIEQPQPGYWHYCPGAGLYYPQVQACPGGWQLVPPQPGTGN